MKKTDASKLALVSVYDKKTIRTVCQIVHNPMIALECFQKKYPFLFTSDKKRFVSLGIENYFMNV